MEAAQVSRAVASAKSTASSIGLMVDDAIVLHNSNKLTLRLLPCDVVARVAPADQQVARFEIELAQQLVAAGCPVAAEGRGRAEGFRRTTRPRARRLRRHAVDLLRARDVA